MWTKEKPKKNKVWEIEGRSLEELEIISRGRQYLFKKLRRIRFYYKKSRHKNRRVLRDKEINMPK